MQAFRESILAVATGAGAGGAATFMIAREVWQRAQAQGDAIDSTCLQLQKLRGDKPELPPQVVPPQPLHNFHLAPSPRPPPISALRAC